MWSSGLLILDPFSLHFALSHTVLTQVPGALPVFLWRPENRDSGIFSYWESSCCSTSNLSWNWEYNYLCPWFLAWGVLLLMTIVHRSCSRRGNKSLILGDPGGVLSWKSYDHESSSPLCFHYDSFCFTLSTVLLVIYSLLSFKKAQFLYCLIAYFQS